MPGFDRRQRSPECNRLIARKTVSLSREDVLARGRDARAGDLQRTGHGVAVLFHVTGLNGADVLNDQLCFSSPWVRRPKISC